MDDEIGVAEALEERGSEIHRRHGFAAQRILHDQPLREYRGLADRVEDAEAIQDTGCVRRDLQAGADLAERR